MEDLSLFSRRDFLKAVGALSATTLNLWGGGCEACWKQIQNRPMRKNISNLSPSDPVVQTYKAAVAAMKALGPTDNRNWQNRPTSSSTTAPTATGSSFLGTVPTCCTSSGFAAS
jgi:hypothetical protein